MTDRTPKREAPPEAAGEREQDERVAPHRYGGDEASPVDAEEGEGISHEAALRREGQERRQAEDDEEPRARPDIAPFSHPPPQQKRGPDRDD